MAEAKQDTPEEHRAYILTAPAPMDGPPIWERATGDDGYEMSGLALARALLTVAEDDPALLDVSAERENDPTGWEAANNDKLWEAAMDRWEGLDDWLGGVSGFQYGWAHNAVRYVLGAEATGNPAIMTLGEK